jgi:hypothetical protein
MTEMRKETDSLGVVEVPADKLWGAQTQRSLEHFSIGKDLIPREMITSYAILKKAAAIANHDSKRLDDQRYKLIVQTCDEILAGPCTGRSAEGPAILALLRNKHRPAPVRRCRSRRSKRRVLQSSMMVGKRRLAIEG